MKLTLGQLIPVALAVVLTAFLIYDAPFEAANVAASASQVVYAPISQPPVIAGAAAKLDVSLLLMELGFVAFVAAAIFFAATQKKRNQ